MGAVDFSKQAGSMQRPSMQRLTLTSLATLAMVAASIPVAPASAVRRSTESYETCAEQLLATLDLKDEQVIAACARAFHPEKLSQCVLDIHNETKLTGTDILNACQRVRRPKELAKCTIDIDRTFDQISHPGVLDYCRRSLLPRQFANCVVGLHREFPLRFTPAMDLMETCISANDLPTILDPSFIPLEE